MESTTVGRYIRLPHEEQLTWVKAIKIRIPHLRVQLNSIRAARKLFTSCVRTLRGGDEGRRAEGLVGRLVEWAWCSAQHSMWEDGNVLMKNRNVL